MKAIKYVVAGALLFGWSATATAQDYKSDLNVVTKAIQAKSADMKEQVKNYSKNYKKNGPALAGLARAFYEAKDTANAKKWAEEAISRDKSCGDGYILLGDLEVLKDDGGAAASWYQNAITMDPKNPKGYIKYASIYRGRSPEEAVKKLEALRQIMPDYPVDAEAAHFFYGARKYDKALEYYGKVNMDVLEDNQLREYALAGYFSGNNDKSLEVSTFGNKKFPRDAVLNRMTFYNSLAKKDYPTAITFADKLINASDSAKLIARDYTNYGHAYMGDKQYDNAVSMFRKSMEMEEDHELHKLISDAYSEKGDIDNALEAYNTYVSKKANPTSGDYMSLAAIYTNAAEKVGDVSTKEKYLKKADDVYAQLIQKNPDYEAYGTYMRATINGQMDPDFSKGLSKPYWEKLINIVNGHATKGSNDTGYLKAAYYNLGAIAYTAGNKDTGDGYMRQLLEVDPDNETAKSMLGIQ